MIGSEHAGIIKALIQTWMYELNCNIPAVVTAVNDNGTVNIRLGIKKPRMKENGEREYELSAEQEEVPVKTFSCGGFSMRLPVRVGCRGYAEFSDLDHDNFFLGIVDGNGISEPHTSRYHAFNDVVFTPSFNDENPIGEDGVFEIENGNVKLLLSESGFDVIKDGQSLMGTLNACCNGAFSGWQP